MSALEISLIQPNEINELQKFSKETFIEAFSNQNSEENMRKYLDENLSIQQLINELMNSESLFYFARMDEKIIGYLKINFGVAQTDFKEDNSIEIERVYVLEEFQGKNVGQNLLNKAIEICIEKCAILMAGCLGKELQSHSFLPKKWIC
jgi:GNAT superfamily N-acetyltransferase